MKKFWMKQFKLSVRFGLLAALVMGMMSCPKEITEKVYLDQKGHYFLPPLASVVVHETFDAQAALSITDSGSSLDGINGIFRTTTAVPADAVISVVGEKIGKSLKIENRGRAGGGINTEFLFIPTQNAFDHLGNRVLLQYRLRLENTDNVYVYGPNIHHTRYPSGGAPGGNVSVQARLYGSGQFQFNNNAGGADVWEATAVGQNEWHLIEILFDFESDRYKGYVNGKEVIDELFRNISSPRFGTVRFYLNSYNTAAYLDDIRITTDSVTGPFAPPVIHYVTFNKNHSDSSSTGWTEANPQIIPVTTPPATTVGTLPEPPTRAGSYFFNGWNTRPDGSGTPFTASTTVTGNITVYARWEPDVPCDDCGCYGIDECYRSECNCVLPASETIFAWDNVTDPVPAPFAAFAPAAFPGIFLRARPSSGSLAMTVTEDRAFRLGAAGSPSNLTILMVGQDTSDSTYNANGGVHRSGQFNLSNGTFRLTIDYKDAVTSVTSGTLRSLLVVAINNNTTSSAATGSVLGANVSYIGNYNINQLHTGLSSKEGFSDQAIPGPDGPDGSKSGRLILTFTPSILFKNSSDDGKDSLGTAFIAFHTQHDNIATGTGTYNTITGIKLEKMP